MPSSSVRHRRCGARGLGVATALVLTAAAAGCTSSASQPAPPTEPVLIHTADAPVPGAEARASTAADTCPIVARTAVEQRLGGNVVGEQVGVGPLGSTVCTFALAATNVGHSGVVSVSLDTHGSAAAFARGRAAYPVATTLDHVGDHAFYVAAVRLLQMIVGRSVVTLRASVSAPATPVARPTLLRHDLVALARDVAAGR